MFEVGKHYKFHLWKPGANGGEIYETCHYAIIEERLPLLKIWAMAYGETIFNTSSPTFVSATEVDESGAALPNRGAEALLQIVTSLHDAIRK